MLGICLGDAGGSKMSEQAVCLLLCYGVLRAVYGVLAS